MQQTHACTNSIIRLKSLNEIYILRNSVPKNLMKSTPWKNSKR